MSYFARTLDGDKLGITTLAPESIPSIRPLGVSVASAVVEGMSALGNSKRVMAIVANVRPRGPSDSLPNGVEG